MAYVRFPLFSTEAQDKGHFRLSKYRETLEENHIQ